MAIIVCGHHDDTLGALMKCGATDIEFWCVSGRVDGRPCNHRHNVRIEALIQVAGADVSLVRLAKLARCKFCRKLGCHVQAISLIGYGRPEWAKHRLLNGMISRIWAENDDDPGTGPDRGRGALKAES